ncbi:MAG TPA: carboxypeptidase-like regulatory domain-containing protein [Solirubrobacteraceae bacterium]
MELRRLIRAAGPGALLAASLAVAAAPPAPAASSAPAAVAKRGAPPRFVARPRGNLLTTRPGVRGVRYFHVRAFDARGLTSVRLLDVKASGGIAHYYKLCKGHACPRRINRRFRFDTRRIDNGVHVFYVEIRDRDGRRTDVGAWLVSTFNRGRPGGFAALSVSVHRGRRHARVLTVDYGQAGTIQGRLTGGTGQPLSLAHVEIFNEEELLGPSTKVADAYTDVRGRFRWRMRWGTSRNYTLTFSYQGTVVGAARVGLSVRAGVRARPNHLTLRGRHRLVVNGRAVGGPIPQGGLVVLLQARHGRRWQTFEAGHTGSGGGFHVGYRFIQQGRGAFRLRALIPRQPSYPYVAGTSRGFTVRLK